QGALKMMVRDGVTAAELEESKECLVNSVPRMLETNGAVASALADIQFYNLGLDYFERYPQLIGGVSRGDIRRVAREYLHPDNLAIVAAGPVQQPR
ncbi:MAG: insulinase family protein, partial [Candidatus Aureabacteria bacterium]|nr:insulinase family protein [Candidatus Auribacterota bacterium]